MSLKKDYKDKIFFSNNENFTELALELFAFQSENNAVYRQFLEFAGISGKKIRNISEIPFLPVEFFKTHRVITEKLEPEMIFSSSGTTSSIPSRHYIHDPDLYKASSEKCFEFFFGEITQYTFLALLPSYLERNDSSLVFMLDHFMKKSGKAANGFFLNDYDNLLKKILLLKKNNEKVVLFGVSFALAEFAAEYQPDLSDIIVMETGGMKGRRSELTRQELHHIIIENCNTPQVSSEYGMTELLSQAYSLRDGIFEPVPWMKVLCRDLTDPFVILPTGEQGAVNIIDLANIYSCAFIATSDIGKLYADGSFEILGRMDNSEIRGCNLLAGM